MSYNDGCFLSHYKHRFLLVIFLINVLNAAQHNFYIGTNVGISGFLAKNSSEVDSTAPTSQNLYTNKSIKVNGTVGGVYLGCILRIQHFGLGTELSWQYASLERTLDGKFDDPANGDDLNFTIKNKLTGQLELCIKPGCFIYDYFTYAILGLNIQNMYYSYSTSGRRAGGDVQNFSGKTSKYVKGYTFGIGVQKNIYEHIGLAIEFKASKFPQRDYKFNLPSIPLATDINISSKLKDIQAYSCCLRFMYTF